MTDFRALCAELVDAIDSGISTDRMHLSPVMFRARAALAQHEPAPTDEELLQVAASAISPYEDCGIGIGEYEEEAECAIEVYGSELIAFAREVLARWGHA